MDQIFKQMLERYPIDTLKDKKNAFKEVVQEIVLCGLSKDGFFNEVGFYGGTALRIFYNLDRFSEDLDFSLISRNVYFDLTKYFDSVSKELKFHNLDFSIIEKKKTKESTIKSAFLKGNTKELILRFYNDGNLISSFNKEEIIKIKFEVDISPTSGANYEYKYGLLPEPYKVRLFDLPSLFAGKIHAILCRGWKNRIKGRDLYDFVFYLSKGVNVNLIYLKNKLVDSGFIDGNFDLNEKSLKELLIKKFKTINFEEAKKDVRGFISNESKLDLWSNQFFISITDRININE